jgi:hypothetical protein
MILRLHRMRSKQREKRNLNEKLERFLCEFTCAEKGKGKG